jgi:hypothetical protein
MRIMYVLASRCSHARATSGETVGRYRVKYATATAVCVASIILGGCGFPAKLLTRQDPAYAPTKADPVFITVGAHSTIQDRQMLPLITHEFQVDGFNLTDFDNSKWVVVVGSDDRTIVTGTTSSSVGIANPVFRGLLGVSTTTTHDTTEKLEGITLSLVTKESVVRGDPIEVWQGRITTTDPDQMKDHPKTLSRALIDQYGKNFEDSSFRLPRGEDSP